MRPAVIPQALELALRAYRAGDLAAAADLLQQTLQADPAQAEALALLALVHQAGGRPAEAEPLMRRALALRPDMAAWYSNLGSILLALGRQAESLEAHARAISLDPALPEAHCNLANTLRSAGRLAEAEAAYARALALRPDYVAALVNRGLTLRALGRVVDAEAVLRHAVGRHPASVPARMGLGNLLASRGRLDEAAGLLGDVVAAQPTSWLAHANYGNLLRDQGLLEEALAHLRRAVELAPAEPTPHSHLLYALHFHPADDPAALLAEHRCWSARHAAPLAAHVRPHANGPDPRRRLRVGYVSPDFREHAVGRHVLPVLEHHDPQAVEVCCYSGVTVADALTARFRQCATGWREVAGLSDAELADAIRADGIDLLVDLTLHMSGGRLLTFARRPAPVQLTWAGYPSTTGLQAIDYRLTDARLDPPGHSESFSSEKLLWLPDSFWCFDPLGVDVDPGEGPRGPVRFGSLGNFCKINGPLLELWAQVLTAVPGSLLTLLAPAGAHRQRVVEALGRLGVAPGRVEFLEPGPRAQYLAYCRQIDIVLDTFPYNGHMTALDALWMGVPIVSLAGRTAVSRGGLSLLSTIGRKEWASADRAGYLARVAALAADPPRTVSARGRLREQLRSSPLMDATRFARGLEALYRQVWETWCRGEGSR